MKPSKRPRGGGGGAEIRRGVRVRWFSPYRQDLRYLRPNQVAELGTPLGEKTVEMIPDDRRVEKTPKLPRENLFRLFNSSDG